MIVLHSRTPEKNGFILKHRMRQDMGDHRLPGDADQNLRQRNCLPGGRYDSIAAPFADLKFAAGITVADLGANRGNISFEEAHPNAHGWVEAYLPGYSKDGSLAVVRALVGPSPHGAVVTALLEKNGDKWTVKWHQLSYFA